MRKAMALAIVAALTMAALAAAREKKIRMNELPVAVQQAVTEHSRGATLRGLSTEMTDGRRVYEAELHVNGRTKDVTFDATGALVSLEEEVAIDEIPAAARAAIEKGTGNGKVRRVEAVTQKGTTYYEAQISRAGRHSEIKVTASGETVR
jgi:uncharacterized membrane protein YkoI